MDCTTLTQHLTRTFKEFVSSEYYSHCEDVNPGDYIFPLLLLKHISDIRKDYREQGRKYQNHPQLLALYKQFKLPRRKSFDDLYSRRDDLDVGELINWILRSVGKANSQILGDAFDCADFTSNKLGTRDERDKRLSRLISNLDRIDLRPSYMPPYVIREVCKEIAERTASLDNDATIDFRVPSQIAELVVELCSLNDKSRVCDPASGFGELLIKASSKCCDYDRAFYGIEADKRVSALCRINACLGLPNPIIIESGNTLMSTKTLGDEQWAKFDNIVTCPSFLLNQRIASSEDMDICKLFWSGETSFINRMIESVFEQKGKVVVVVPSCILSGTKTQDSISAELIRKNLLDAVIGLPANLFQSSADQAAILIFDRSREEGGDNEDRKDVLFIDASRDYDEKAVSPIQKTLLGHRDVEKTLATYRKRIEEERYAHKISYQELEDNDFDLSIELYVKDSAQRKIQSLEKELAELKTNMDQFAKESQMIMRDEATTKAP